LLARWDIILAKSRKPEDTHAYGFVMKEHDHPTELMAALARFRRGKHRIATIICPE